MISHGVSARGALVQYFTSVALYHTKFDHIDLTMVMGLYAVLSSYMALGAGELTVLLIYWIGRPLIWIVKAVLVQYFTSVALNHA